MPSNGDIIPPGKVLVNEENQLREANGDGKLEAQKRPKPFKSIYSRFKSISLIAEVG
jgi:hypothetical protein